MKEPVDHIERPRLPWRPADEPSVTECGHKAEKVQTISRDKFFARLKEYGQQRTALLTCMTCLQTAQRHPAWDEEPRKALQREIEWECGWRKQKNGRRLKDELLSIETLIANNREEFDDLLVALRERQEWIDRKNRQVTS